MPLHPEEKAPFFPGLPANPNLMAKKGSTLGRFFLLHTTNLLTVSTQGHRSLKNLEQNKTEREERGNEIRTQMCKLDRGGQHRDAGQRESRERGNYV